MTDGSVENLVNHICICSSFVGIHCKETARLPLVIPLGGCESLLYNLQLSPFSHRCWSLTAGLSAHFTPFALLLFDILTLMRGFIFYLFLFALPGNSCESDCFIFEFSSCSNPWLACVLKLSSVIFQFHLGIKKSSNSGSISGICSAFLQKICRCWQADLAIKVSVSYSGIKQPLPHLQPLLPMPAADRSTLLMVLHAHL